MTVPDDSARVDKMLSSYEPTKHARKDAQSPALCSAVGYMFWTGPPIEGVLCGVPRGDRAADCSAHALTVRGR